MHLVRNISKSGKKIYQSILLRESYRENGKVKKRTIANLSHCSEKEIAAIELALRHKDALSVLGSLKEDIELQEGLSVGAVWTVYQVARQLGIDKCLGNKFHGKLALWQVIARVIEQGSRLSAVRLAQTHAACEVLSIQRDFDENDLYDNLRWLAENQEKIEDRLFLGSRGKGAPELFLYDVTSSYLEGEHNYFAAYGYNRDGKKGKKQIVIGLLCDMAGEPLSVEVFEGNTQDIQTFGNQVRKVANRFGCRGVTFVGDRGMIKSAQIEDLPEGFHYITAITKPQIESLMNQGVIQIELFNDALCEVRHEDVRYIIRRNPVRADEIRTSRKSKILSIQKLIDKKNEYLNEHPRANILKAKEAVREKIKRLKAGEWLRVESLGRELRIEMDEEKLIEESLLDGCYVIKTDLLEETADKQIVHDRYKDLAEVEKAFRICKMGLLEVRPVYVRTEASTRGHVFVVMLAYLIIRRIRKAWNQFDLTVQEGLKQLSTLCSMEMKVKGQGSCLKIPRPRKNSRKLLKALHITMPLALPHNRDVHVVTRKKLTKQRKSL